jgi:hypothetical protein
MALTKNTQIAFEIGDLAELPVLTNAKIYEGALGGIDAGTGYVRPLTAGDAAVGFAESPADNTGGASGAIRARFREHGKAVLSIANLAITDIDKPVYASDDGTFTLTAGSNSFVGVVDRFISSGVGLVAFDFRRGRNIAALTDSSTGTADGTIADVGAAFNQATLNNNFADLAAKINAILKTLK